MAYTINEKINFRSYCTEKTKMFSDKIKSKYKEHNLNYILSPKGNIPNDYDWTKPRDFFRMPVGQFELTDKIYDYTVKKFKEENGEESWMINQKGTYSGNSMWLHTFEEHISEKVYEPWKIKRISANANIGGLYIHSEDGGYRIVTKLIIMPRGSFKEYVKKEIQQSNQIHT